MDREIVTYALVRYCWGEGADHLDCFWPFAVRAMPGDEKLVDLSYIKKQVKDQFELDVPLHSLNVILRRAEQGEYISRSRTQRLATDKYCLTKKGLAYQNDVLAESEVERMMNAMFVDIRQFVDQDFNFKVSEQDISKALLALIHRNIEPLAEFLNPGVPTQHPIPFTRRLNRLGNYLAKYMGTADKKKPEHYKTLRDIILGAILTTVLNAQDISKVSKGETLQFKGLELFLDSNYIFSILGLHEKEFNDAAIELLDLLKSHKFKLKVFSFTVDEVCRVMNGYIVEGHKYPVSFNVENSIYSKLKRDGWKYKDVKDFVMSIEEKLKEIGIETQIVTDVDLDNYVASNELRVTISQRKPLQPLSSQNHDLAAIDKIKAFRRHPVRRLKNAKVLFLTSDRWLNQFNFIDMGHRSNGTIGEVVLDSLLTNILWLSNPKANVSLKSIIAAHSRGLFINRGVWLKFYEALRRIRLEGKVDDGATSTLFYDDFIQKELADFDRSQIESIDEKFALDKVERASKLAKSRQEEKEAEFIGRLTEAQTQIERREQDFSKTLETIKMKFRKSSISTGNRISIFFSALLSAVLVATTWFLFEIVVIGWLIAIVPSGSGGLILIWFKFRPWCKNKIAAKNYAKSLAEIGLDDTEAPSVTN
ncbi:hypothetical protein ES703_88382 [subsurface metagenome]